jgi:hypothetical protein
VLEILGPVTWALPDWIDRRLPRIRIEGHAAEQDAADAERSRDEAPLLEPTPSRS